MNDKVSAYFQASKELANMLSDAQKLKQQVSADDDTHLLDVQIQRATEKVDEFVEIFTWETQDTDLIRRSFLEIAKNTLPNMQQRNSLLTCDEFTALADNQDQLFIDNIVVAMHKALSSKGRYVPRVQVPQHLTLGCYQIAKDYLQLILRQLRNATFDNLLEAIIYFEKSTLLLRLQYENQQKTKKF